MRAAGYSWEAVSKKVKCKARTCMQWPWPHQNAWAIHYETAH